jgi:hypothetical protein
MYWKNVQPCWLAEKAFRLDTKAVPTSGKVFEALWQLSPSQLFLFSNTRTFPLKGKDELALWCQSDAEKYILKD